MTHEQIEAAIERLRKIPYMGTAYNAFEILEAVVPDDSWMYGLIDLLRQADPDTHMELPVDADGEYIHVGDVMERGEARARVIALMLSEYPEKWGGGLHWGVQLGGEQAPTALDLTFHHYHAPTVEDVLRECCDAYAHVEGTDSEDETIAKYAAKLREVMADDDAR